MKIGVISDTHHHNWSQFASIDEDGMNTRLKIILDETYKAFEHMVSEGVEAVIHAGDLFHVRGKIAPTVLNPTLDAYRKILKKWPIGVLVISGNHDLESNSAHEMSSAITALGSLERIKVINEPLKIELKGCGFNLHLLPWQDKLSVLRGQLSEASQDSDGRKNVVICHAPVNDVISGIPNTGISANEIEDLGIDLFLAGHYHNHKKLSDRVYSVGALTHQTWGDVGSKAGYLIIDLKDDGDFEVKHYETAAPKFVRLNDRPKDVSISEWVAGNYVKASVSTSDSKVIKNIRGLMEKRGAAGSIVSVFKTAATPALGAKRTSVSAAPTLIESVRLYVENIMKPDTPKELVKLCGEILNEVQA